MTATIGSFKNEIRAILRDTTAANYHYTDDQVYAATVDGFRRLYAVRPESRYTGANGTLNDVAFPTDATLASFSVSFEERWRLGIVYFAAARCYETDTTDTVNMQLSQSYFKKADEVFMA